MSSRQEILQAANFYWNLYLLSDLQEIKIEKINRHGFLELNEKMAEEMPQFTFLKGTVDDFIDDKDNKNTQAKTDIYNLAENISSNEGQV